MINAAQLWVIVDKEDSSNILENEVYYDTTTAQGVKDQQEEPDDFKIQTLFDYIEQIKEAL